MWIVTALCILIALTILLLCVPVDLLLRVGSTGKPAVNGRVEWLFGRVGKDFRTREEQEQPARSAGEKKSSGKKEKRDKKRRPSRDSGELVWRIIRVPGLWKSIGRLVRRLLRFPHVRRLYVDCRVGLEDPADTALVLGPVSQVASFADLWSPYSFRVTPVFENAAVFQGEGALDMRLYPIRAVAPVAAFLLSPSTIRVIAMLVVFKCRRK